MKKIFIVLLLVCFGINPVYAQETLMIAGPGENHGSRAVLGQTNGSSGETVAPFRA